MVRPSSRLSECLTHGGNRPMRALAASSTWLAEDAAGGLGSRIEDSCFSSMSGASFN